MKHPEDQKGISDRVQKLIDARKEATTLFAGINNIGKKLRGELNWTHKDIGKICEHTKASEEWVTSGVGDMYKPLAEIEKMQQRREGNRKYMFTETLPRLPFKAMDGGIREYFAGNKRDECQEKPIAHQFPEYHFTVLVDKDYMSPYINTGDILACREVNSVEEEGGVYVIDTGDEAIIKRVYKLDGGRYKLVSDNPRYPERIITQEAVIGIYKAIGLLRVGI